MKRLPIPSIKYLLVAFILAFLAGVGAPTASLALTPSASRGQAIHDCSVEANKWSMISWQSAQLQVYGECMAGYGQPQ